MYQQNTYVSSERYTKLSKHISDAHPLTEEDTQLGIQGILNLTNLDSGAQPKATYARESVLLEDESIPVMTLAAFELA